MDVEIYSKLVELDARLGIETFKQLYWCLLLAPRSDFIQVWIKFLNIAAGIIFKIIDFARVEATMPNREFSDVYLISCRKEFGSGVKIDVEVYKKLLELDTRLGRSVSDQLFNCLSFTTRPDIIKVCICNLNIQNFWKLLKAVDLEKVSEYDCIRKKGYFGFAGFYLSRFNDQSTSDEKIDIQIYQTLAKLDARLGTTFSDQLIECLGWTTRLDIIEVWLWFKMMSIVNSVRC